jgi:hypothetical protein
VATTKAKFSDVDRDAFTRAIDTMLRSPESIYRKDFRRRLSERKERWEDIGRHAASVCQCRALGLDPWEVAPCEAEPNQGDMPGYEHRHRAVASALVGRLLAAGRSRFEPDPIGTLAEAEKSQGLGERTSPKRQVGIEG